MHRIVLFFFLTGIFSTSLFSQVLSITSTAPDVNAQYVDASTNIEVVFDKNISTATVYENTFVVNGNYTGKITGVYSVTDNTVTFNPDNDFRPGEVVTVTLTTAIESRDAEHIEEGISWQFTIKSLTSTTVFSDQKIISTSADGAKSVLSIDLDGDGDMDVLSASYNDDKIAWYENDDDENFTEHTILTSANGAQSVFSVDLDGDGDMDVLSASYYDDKIAWHENNGNENFTTHTITTDADGAQSVFSIDLDGDGDMDVLSASKEDDKIAWYENGGNENFSEHTISTSADGALSVFSVDLDGDGDMDVLSASFFDNKIAWYENDGDEHFTSHTITTSTQYASSVFSADIDQDGDMDVLSASWGGNKIAWYENDGNKNFSSHAITNSTNTATSVFSADLNGDGNMDVLSASYSDNKIAWYENDVNENFSAHTITTSAREAASVFCADLDGDGDMDILSASSDDDKIAWYENKSLGLSANITSSCEKNNDIIFTASSFPYNDFQLKPLTGFQVKDLPDKGYLYFDDNSDDIAQQIELLTPDAVLTTAQLDENKLKYKPFIDEYGAAYATFTFKVENKDGFSLNTYTVTINVDNTTSPPTAVDGEVTTDEDVNYKFAVVDFNFSDVDGHAFEGIKVTELPAEGTLLYDGNSITAGNEAPVVSKLVFKPSPDEFGTPYTTFKFMVKDESGSFSLSEYTMTINVNSVEDPNVIPVVVANSGCTVSEGGTFTFSDVELSARDGDGPSYSIIYNILKSPTHGCFFINGALFKTESVSFTQNDIANGKVTYTHNGDESETDVFRFTVSDNEGGTSPEYNFDITIFGANEPPVIDSLPSIRFDEDDEFYLDLKTWYEFVNDVDTPDSSLSFSFSCSNNCIHFSEIENNTCTITGNENYFGSDSILVTVSDGEFSCTCSIELIIEEVNDLPVINGLPSSVTITNGEVEDINIWDNVEDVETPDGLLTIGFMSNPDSLYKYYDYETGMLSIAAMSSFAGEIELTILVIDEDNGVTNETINIAIEKYFDPNPTGTEDENSIPNEIQLSQNYPNPFNPSTVIRYGIPVGGAFNASQHVTLRVYDTLGNEIATLQNGHQSPGFYERNWHAEDLSSGIYFYVLRVGRFVESKKMILLK